MSSVIRPHTYVALRLPSDTHRILKVIPDTTISIGKFGAFPANSILGRPFYLTFEIQDKEVDEAFNGLRIVSASELHAETATDDDLEARDGDQAEETDEIPFDVVDEKGEYVFKSNRLTMDEGSRQTLTMQEIEDLKNAASSGSGRETIARIMKSHSGLDEKTAFSLAKYTLRKTKKYLKRFSILPLDVNMLARWFVEEKDPSRTMELREETLGLIASWSNIHHVESPGPSDGGQANGRWLVVDDTGGLLVALLAERLGTLQPRTSEEAEAQIPDGREDADEKDTDEDTNLPTLNGTALSGTEDGDVTTQPHVAKSRSRKRHPPEAMSATSNTLTLLHHGRQASLALLAYFNYDPNTHSDPTYPAHCHPLYTQLKTISWLQLATPNLDPTYVTAPSPIPESELAALKSNKRGAYFRKRRRWEQTRRVVDETRSGGFDGLIVASSMDPTSVLHYTVPLLKGGASVVVYNPNIQPLTNLMDAYSTERKTGYLTALGYTDYSDELDEKHDMPEIPSDDFPLDPRLLLAPTLQTVRAVPWQVLPGRTHPLMMSRGGAEGYLFTATKVLPVEGKISARGKFNKKRKTENEDNRVSDTGIKPESDT